MIYIIRHGQTELNNAHVLQGRSDYPLNDKGIAQAHEVGQWFTNQGIDFSYVYSSPLKRAVRTAELITQEKPIVLDDRLIEMDYGPYEGIDLGSPAPEITTFFSDFVNNPAPEGMEPLSKVVQRTGAFLEDIKELSGNILISTHAIAMKGALEYLTPGSNGSYWSKYIGNCAVYVADNIDGKISVPEEIKIGSGFMSLKETSKFMSLILRHKPEIINISLDEHGWADVSELIAGIAKTNDFSMDILEEIVRTDEKQRYSFNEDKTLIRANQGHSIPVDVELDEAEPPVELWHGTGEKFVASIDEQGLISRSRLYVHLSKDSDTAIKVGKRHGKPVLYIVKAAEMYKNGYKFYLSKNGVWLTKEVPVKYLVKQ